MPGNSRTFLQPARAVPIPIPTERHVDAHVVTQSLDAISQWFAHPEQHLKLKPGFIDSKMLAPFNHPFDDRLIVRGNGYKGVGTETTLDMVQEMLIDGRSIPPGPTN